MGLFVVRNVRETGSETGVNIVFLFFFKEKDSKVKYLSVETILKDSEVVLDAVSDWSLGDHTGISSIRLKEARL